jgi:hypothetical protein
VSVAQHAKQGWGGVDTHQNKQAMKSNKPAQVNNDIKYTMMIGK